MALRSYGVLKGKAIEVRLGAGQSPHYQVRIVDDTTDYRIAVNVKSQLPPSEVEFVVIEHFQHPITPIVERLPRGFTTLERKPGSGALDFIRGNLFDRATMRPLPFSVPGFDNDLNEKLDRVMQRAVADEDALVYTFGERWRPAEHCPTRRRPVGIGAARYSEEAPTPLGGAGRGRQLAGPCASASGWPCRTRAASSRWWMREDSRCMAWRTRRSRHAIRDGRSCFDVECHPDVCIERACARRASPPLAGLTQAR